MFNAMSASLESMRFESESRATRQKRF